MVMAVCRVRSREKEEAGALMVSKIQTLGLEDMGAFMEEVPANFMGTVDAAQYESSGLGLPGSSRPPTLQMSEG